MFDRRDQALDQLIRVVKPGGAILLSVMSLWGAVHQYLGGVLEVPDEANRKILETGDLTPDTVGEGRHYCHMFRAAELRDLLERHGLQILVLSASNALSTNATDALAALDETDEAWPQLLEMEIEACQEPGCLDLGSHMIAACRVPAMKR